MPVTRPLESNIGPPESPWQVQLLPSALIWRMPTMSTAIDARYFTPAESGLVVLVRPKPTTVTPSPRLGPLVATMRGVMSIRSLSRSTAMSLPFETSLSMSLPGVVRTSRT